MAVLKIGELLKSKGLINEKSFRIAMLQQAVTGDLLGDTFVKLGFVSPREIAQALAQQSGIEFINIENYGVSEEALRMFPRDTAESAGFLPLNIENGVLSIAITNSANLRAVDTATKASGRPPKVFMTDAESFNEKLEKAYYFLEHPIHKSIDKITEEIKKSGAMSGQAISTLVELLFMDGVRRNATDIHISPSSEVVHVLYRIDGVLQHAYCLPKLTQNGIVSRIKILSQLDIAEQRLPQDGSFSFSFLKKECEMRVSLIPTIYGENIVIRILGSSGQLLNITSLGFDEHETQRLRKLFSKPHGIMLVVGPTGSGKTTTLYAAIREINLIERNVLTVEDPVEYKLSMLRQTKVSAKTGYDFRVAGRSFMRHDPDVILIGEIRDEETAKIAIRASITGHLVLSTLHTNDAVTAIPRLIDLNIDRFLLSSSLLAIVAQRLVRKICGNCKTEYSPGETDLRVMDIPEAEWGGIKTLFRGKGCALCDHTGYLGRTAIGEILVVNDRIREQIYAGSSVFEMTKTAVENGMKTLRDCGVKKALEGVTTFEEVMRVAG